LKRVARGSLPNPNAEAVLNVCAEAPDHETAFTFRDIIKDIAQFVPEEIVIQCQSRLISLT
jgi:hypothetical protein